MAKVAIVGGGIAGLYCAWKLLKNPHKNHSVSLYELLPDLGGRIETHKLDGFTAECGPMRFELGIEPTLSDLLKTLEITPTQFPPPVAGLSEFPKYDLLPSELSHAHRLGVEKILGKGSHSELVSGMLSQHTTALDLLKYGIYRILNSDDPKALDLTLENVVREVASGGQKKSSIISEYAERMKDEYNYIRTELTLNDQPLKNYGFWNALNRVLSPGAIAKLRDTGTFYHLLPENPSASEWSIFWLRLFCPNSELSTIKVGVGTIVEKLKGKITSLLELSKTDDEQLEEVYNDRHTGKHRLTLKCGAIVERIENDAGTHKLRLTLRNGTIMDAFDHVILAVPAVPLKELSETFPKNIRYYVESVIPFPLLKIFVVIKEPWWKETRQPQQGAHLVPTREVHYFEDENGRDRAMIMFYTDRPATAYWQVYVDPPHERALIWEPGTRHDPTARQLLSDIAGRVARLLPDDLKSYEQNVIQAQEKIVRFAIRDWSKAPFGAACHAWKPNIDVVEALRALRAFSLDGAPAEHQNVHICGEAYSDYQGFIEGALTSAEKVLTTIS